MIILLWMNTERSMPLEFVLCQRICGRLLMRQTNQNMGKSQRVRQVLPNLSSLQRRKWRNRFGNQDLRLQTFKMIRILRPIQTSEGMIPSNMRPMIHLRPQNLKLPHQFWRYLLHPLLLCHFLILSGCIPHLHLRNTSSLITTSVPITIAPLPNIYVGVSQAPISISLSTPLYTNLTFTTTSIVCTHMSTVNISDTRAVTFSAIVGPVTSTTSPLRDDDPDLVFGGYQEDF